MPLLPEKTSEIHAVGNGYNTFLATAMATVVHVTTEEAGGHSIKAEVSICETKEELLSSLEMSASLAVSSPWGSFSDKMDFLQTFSSSTTTLVILVSASKVVSQVNVKTATFSKQYETVAELYTEGGDSYVSFVRKGGQFIAAYFFEAHDETQLLSVKNEAKTAFGIGSSTFEGSFGTKIDNIASKSGVSYKLKQLGIGFSTGTLPKPDQFVDFVLNFGSFPLDGPEVLSYSTKSYSTVKGFPADFKQVDFYRDQWASSISWEEPDLSSYVLLLQTTESLVKQTRSIYDFYGMSSVDPKLESNLKGIETDMSHIRKWLATVHNDPSKAGIKLPKLVDKYLERPIPQYSLNFGTASGGSGGDFFSDITMEQISWGVRPAAFQLQALPEENLFMGIHFSPLVTGITTWYEYQAKGHAPFICTHGEFDGQPSSKINFSSKEWVTSIGTVSHNRLNPDVFISDIGIETTYQPLAWSPDKDPSAQISQKVPANSRFIGWSGSSGWYIDSIRPMWVTFRPAVWTAPV